MAEVLNSPGMETLVRLILLLPVTVSPQHCKEAGTGTVTAAIGSDVILPCVSKDEIKVTDLIIDWTKEGDEIYIFRDGNGSFPHNDYKNRTSVFTEELQNNNMSLKLSGVKQTDEGQFCCCYDHGDNRRTCTNVTLTVITETPANKSETHQNPEDPGLRPHAAVTASVFLLLCVGLGAGYCLWKHRNGHGTQDPNQHRDQNRAETTETTALTVVTVSNGDAAE